MSCCRGQIFEANSVPDDAPTPLVSIGSAEDDASVMELIFGNYDPATQNSSWNPTDTELKDWSLRTTGDSDVLYANLSGSKRAVALYATTTSGIRTYVLTYAPDGFDPGGRPIIGGYELDKTSGNWRLDSSNNIVSQAGVFGEPPIATVVDLGVSATTSFDSVVKIIADASSRANPAFLLTTDGTDEGIDNYSLDIVASVNGTLKYILTVDNVAEGSPYPYSYDSSITIMPNGTPYGDIEIDTSGTNGDGTNPAHKMSEQRKFVFKSGAYVKVSN
jgi:hypothetical protein